jgi:hypothetical protein
MKIGQKGQESAVFKLLISAIIALSILVIIVGVISFFDNLKLEISEKRLIDAIVSAANAPGQSIVAKKLSFSEETSYSALAFARKINIEESCIEFVNSTPTFQISADRMTVKQNIQADVFFQCESNSGNLQCPLFCQISFGSRIS